MASHDFFHSEKTNGVKTAAEIDSSDGEMAGVVQEKSLHRQLKNRHIAMIRCISSEPVSSFILCIL
jgi:amino acid permease